MRTLVTRQGQGNGKARIVLLGIRGEFGVSVGGFDSGGAGVLTANYIICTLK